MKIMETPPPSPSNSPSSSIREGAISTNNTTTTTSPPTSGNLSSLPQQQHPTSPIKSSHNHIGSGLGYTPSTPLQSVHGNIHEEHSTPLQHQHHQQQQLQHTPAQSNNNSGTSQIHSDMTPIIRNVSYAAPPPPCQPSTSSSSGGGGGGRGLRQRRLPLPRTSTRGTIGRSDSGIIGGSGGSVGGGGGSEGKMKRSFFPATSPSVTTTGNMGISPPPTEGGCEDETMMVGLAPPQLIGKSIDHPNHKINDEEGVVKSSGDDSPTTPPPPAAVVAMGEGTEEVVGLRSIPGFYSDESSIESSNSNTNNKRGGVGSIVRMSGYKRSKDDAVTTSNNGGGGRGDGVGGGNSFFQLAPIELKPGRKLLSFQGSSMYRQQVGRTSGNGVEGGEDRPMLATIHSPRRTVHNNNNESGGGNYYASPTISTSSPKQYEPVARGQHGVTEMADTKELDAIFKAPRSTMTAAASATPSPKGGGEQQPPTVVTPAKEISSSTTMITNLPPNQDPQDYINDDIHQPFPLDDRQYSIPSIRLANQLRSDGSMSLNDSYYNGVGGTFSEDESTWEGSYFDDDEGTEVSWSTSGGNSIGGGGGGPTTLIRRRSQLIRHLSSGVLSSSGGVDSVSLMGLQHLNSSEGEIGDDDERRSSSLEGLRHLNSSATGQSSSGGLSNNSIPNLAPPAIAPSNSFMERMQGITINQRVNTFESSSDVESYQGGGGPPMILNVSSNPALMLNVTQSMDDAEYETRQSDHSRGRRNHHSHRSGRRSRRSSQHARTSSAVEWIQGLQNPSNGGGIQIVEAASSKFLTGGGVNNVDGETTVTSEDVTKALGMPHPLCRSSTIEAGPFVNRAAAAAAATNGFNGE